MSFEPPDQLRQSDFYAIVGAALFNPVKKKIAQSLGWKKGSISSSDVPQYYFRVRPLQPSDSEAIYDIIQRRRQSTDNPAEKTEDALSRHLDPIFFNRVLAIKARERGEARTIFLVAEVCEGGDVEKADTLEKLNEAAPALPHRLLGWATISPFRKDTVNFKRVAEVSVIILPPSVITMETTEVIAAALIRGCVRACKQDEGRWRVLMAEKQMNTPSSKACLTSLTPWFEAGFRQVGLLESVLERDGEFLNVAVLQLDL